MYMLYLFIIPDSEVDNVMLTVCLCMCESHGWISTIFSGSTAHGTGTNRLNCHHGYKSPGVLILNPNLHSHSLM